jgi:hypothetical protein
MLQSQLRTFTSFWARAVLVCLALSAILVARSIPPNIPTKSSVHCAVRSSSHHDQRPRFAKGLQWICAVAVDVFRLPPPVTESAGFTLFPQHYSTLQTKGFHYNRPPPLG